MLKLGVHNPVKVLIDCGASTAYSSRVAIGELGGLVFVFNLNLTPLR